MWLEKIYSELRQGKTTIHILRSGTDKDTKYIPKGKGKVKNSMFR
jgi:hypothetical protein